MSIIIAVFMYGYKGKTINFALCSPCHRTTLAHFLNEGKWDSYTLENILKSAVISVIYNEAKITGKPVFCIVDDTIASYRRCLFSSVTFKKTSGLWTSGCISNALV